MLGHHNTNTDRRSRHTTANKIRPHAFGVKGAIADSVTGSPRLTSTCTDIEAQPPNTSFGYSRRLDPAKRANLWHLPAKNHRRPAKVSSEHKVHTTGRDQWLQLMIDDHQHTTPAPPPGTSQRRSQQVAALLVGSSLLLVSRPVAVNQVHPHRICLDHRPKINISTNADPHTPLPKEVVSDTPVWRILQLPWVSPSRR